MSGSAASLVEAAIAGVTAPRGDPAAVLAHLDALTKPPGSLGRLEALALQVGVVLGDPPPPLDRATVFIFAADHGVAAQGVSAYPADVTAQMCANLAGGGAAINVLARACAADVRVVDVGVAADLAGMAGVEHRKVRPGTADLSVRAAMTEDEVVEALGVGVAVGGGGDG
ncbi:MAG: nicotinate-nucleotide--dimethylbenzimidazole phosphoribosyltransferase, partial [Gemmatimonadetes bacterium]|nr:nicotinate-nucleotide--dimethylbenzimidazole phosphoribosyltransferase [Gemmatimonadota bacterium]